MAKSNKKNVPLKDVNTREEIRKKIDEDFVKKIEKPSNKRNSCLINILSIATMISCLGYFGSTIFKGEGLKDIVFALLFLLFTVFFISSSITNSSKKKGSNILALVVLFIYQVFGILVMFNIISLPTLKVMENLVDKSLSSAIKWTTDNDVTLEQVYEYSDVVSEYHVIYQSVKPGTKLKNVKKLVLSISEGPNPDKEIVIPSMIGWESEDVLKYIEENHLSNVVFEFVQSSSKENTLIEQSKSGNVKRSDEIKFTFSYGEERGYTEVKMSDLTNKSKTEAIFYLKQHGIKYEIEYEFSDKISRNKVISQNVKPGEMVTITGDNVTTVKIVISKGPKIIIPDFKKMSVDEVTEWIIKNKLKVEFKDSYDEAIKENAVISASHSKGDAVEEGTIITITLSKGKLTMPSFNNLNEFREWADKYNIKYEEQHEFSDDVAAGDVIRYSYRKGETIKNGDTIIATISDGKKMSVPNVKGLSKNDAANKLKSAGLNYSFVYKYSSSVEKGKVISQSISAGSEVSNGTTVTLTISNGKAPSNSNGGGNNNNGGGNNNQPSTPTCENREFYILTGNTGAQTLSATKAAYPMFTIVANYVDSCSNGDSVSGTVCNAGSYDGRTLSTCNTISLTIVK